MAGLDSWDCLYVGRALWEDVWNGLYDCLGAWNGRPEGDGVTGFGEETSAEGVSEGRASSSVLVAGDGLAVLNRHDSRGWVSARRRSSESQRSRAISPVRHWFWAEMR